MQPHDPTPFRPHDLLDGRAAVREFPALTTRLLKTLRQQQRIRYYVIGNRAHYRWSDLYEYVESCAVDGAR